MKYILIEHTEATTGVYKWLNRNFLKNNMNQLSQRSPFLEDQWVTKTLIN